MQHYDSIPKTLAAIMVRAAILGLLGIGLGLAINAVHPHGIAFRRYEPAALCSGSTSPQEIRVLQPQQAAKLCGDSRTLVADVRDGAAFTEGHVAQAVHIPCSGSRADIEAVRTRLVGKEALVVYGHTEEQATKVAHDLAAEIGRPELSIAVIAGGWKAWFDAELACTSGPCDDCKGMLTHAPQ